MKVGLSLIFFFGSLYSLQGQTILYGKVIDFATKESLPFVNVTIPGTTVGTSSGIDGRFTLQVTKVSSLLFSYVGYENLILTNTPSLNGFITVELKQTSQQLQTVEVYAGENPAFEIIRRVLKNRLRNDPENLESFSYQAYHKFYATADGVFDSLGLTKRSGKFLSQHHLFLNESYTERKYRKPSFDKETIIGNRMSGIKDPFFAIVATSFQPFTFYKDHITLLDKNYLNPISTGTFDRYDFQIADTVFHGNDSTFLITFEPLPGKRFEGLKGVLYVNTNGYALEHVLAEPSDAKTLMTLKIQQKYQLVDGAWFPEQLNTEFIFKEYKVLDRPIKYVHRSYITEPKLNVSLTKQEFGLLNVEFTAKANRQDENFWVTSRLDSLTLKERNTYHLYDTLDKSQLATLNSIVKAGEAFAVGKFRVGKFYLPIEDLLHINGYEDYRFGFGLQTSEEISEVVMLHGYAGYGVRDKGFKYGGGIKFNLDNRKDLTATFAYSRDIAEPGNSNFIKPPPLLAGPQRLRNWLASRMDSVEQFGAQLNVRPFRFSEVGLFLTQQRHNPTYSLLGTEVALQNFTLTEVGFQYRFSKGEKFAQIGNSKIVTQLDYPQINFAISHSMDDFLDGEFEYTKVEFSFEHQALIRGLGKTSFQISTGWLTGDAPYFSLFNGRGTKFDEFNFNSIAVVPNHFQTMGVYEFTSDRYAFLFLSHNFGRIVGTKSRYFRPELSLVHNSGIGSLQTKNLESTTLQSLEKGYFESGLIVSNILRIKYLNIAYIGLGAGAFYRYGNYSLPSTSDNIAVKLSLAFGF